MRGREGEERRGRERREGRGKRREGSGEWRVLKEECCGERGEWREETEEGRGEGEGGQHTFEKKCILELPMQRSLRVREKTVWRSMLRGGYDQGEGCTQWRRLCARRWTAHKGIGYVQ